MWPIRICTGNTHTTKVGDDERDTDMKLTLQELKEFALEHANEAFDVGNRFDCLACTLLQKRHGSGKTIWTSRDGMGKESLVDIQVESETLTYYIPPAYGMWCIYICEKSDWNGTSRWQSGQQIADAISQMKETDHDADACG